MLIHRIANSLVALCLLAPSTNALAQQGANEEKQAAPTQVDPHDDADATAEEAADERALQSFYEEMEELLSRTDEFTPLVLGLQTELRQEFKKNEQRLEEFGAADRELAASTRNRQIVIAQWFNELDLRIQARDELFRFGRLQRSVQMGIHRFRQANQELAKRPDVAQKLQEFTQRSHEHRGFGGFPGIPPKLIDTLRTLSPRGWKEPNRQQCDAVHPGAVPGAIQDMRPRIQDMLKLEWDGQNLTLDRDHWDYAFAGKTQRAIRVEVDKLLRDAGFVPDAEDRNNPQQMMQQQGAETSNLARLFRELPTGQIRSQHGGGGKNVNAGFSNETIRAQLRFDGTKFELTIEELTSPKRLFRITEGEGNLDILLVGDMVHRLAQRGDRLQVTEIVGDDVTDHRYKSFADLYRNQPRFVEERLFALWDHLGILLPMTRFDQQVVKRVLERLAMQQSVLRTEVDALVLDLDSKRYTKREAAFARLNDQLDKYFDFIYLRKADPTLSVEARARLTKLLENSQSRKSARPDNVVVALKLIQDEEYLNELREIAEDPKAVELIEATLGGAAPREPGNASSSR